MADRTGNQIFKAQSITGYNSPIASLRIARGMFDLGYRKFRYLGADAGVRAKILESLVRPNAMRLQNRNSVRAV
ncbi:MAG TPA: hypothetical protein DHW63_10420 [Hyphomonadaceae bacterium]|nr:hypothetical protein [Hyphomonadaceae bacterium]